MIVTFEHQYLYDLYAIGKCTEKKYRFQPDVVRRYQKAINFLKAASKIESLWAIHSLNYEVLTGDKAGRSSVRVNDKYRIEFTVSIQEDKPLVTICNVLELSNHYK